MCWIINENDAAEYIPWIKYEERTAAMSISKVVKRVFGISFSILLFILTIYVLYQVGTRSYSFGYRIFTEPPIEAGDGRDMLVQVKNSMGAAEIGELLQEKGLIRDKWLFVLQLKFSEYNKKIQPGIYTLNTSMTAQEMMEVMSEVQKEESAEE